MYSLEGYDEGVGKLEEDPLHLGALKVLQQRPHRDVVHHEDGKGEDRPDGPGGLPEAALLDDRVDDGDDLHRPRGCVREAAPGVRLPLQEGHLVERVQRNGHQEPHEGVLNEAAQAFRVVGKEALGRVLHPPPSRGQRAAEGIPGLHRLPLHEALRAPLRALGRPLQEAQVPAQEAQVLVKDLAWRLPLQEGLPLELRARQGHGPAQLQQRVRDAHRQGGQDAARHRALRAVLRGLQRLLLGEAVDLRIADRDAAPDHAVPELLHVALLLHRQKRPVLETGQQLLAAPGGDHHVRDLLPLDHGPKLRLLDHWHRAQASQVTFQLGLLHLRRWVSCSHGRYLPALLPQLGDVDSGRRWSADETARHEP
mmetsp:Transcript_67805/g.219084  ORF Transcript_67805/g.219084 Transcript_67805/m.219084 type:complete len:367 (+) Transcript_67805:946-2046(+)